ncbi:MAG: GNAT family N-acetyltransferase [Alphaproteobacteria bacterium]|nr:GNAT family N-acetyltransferase [Alphaproteobacteria bacterium]
MKTGFRPLQLNESKWVYDMFQSIPAEENGFKNSAAGLSESEFAEWIKNKINESNGIGLSKGYVPQTIYLLFVSDVPVGFGKLRHHLTPALEKLGGHIAVGIAPAYRDKGYAKIIFTELLKQARVMGIEKILATRDGRGAQSHEMSVRADGTLKKIENNERYYWINT